MKTIIFLGSQRESAPPRPARLGARVARACDIQLKQLGLETEIIDPLDFDLSGIFKPHFAYANGRSPDDLQSLAEKITAADCFVMVSPKYNHAMSPALANLLNHFGSSLFSFKPSAIVTYSAGQWGGRLSSLSGGVKRQSGKMALNLSRNLSIKTRLKETPLKWPKVQTKS